MALSAEELTSEVLVDTLNMICKYKADAETVKTNIAGIVG